MACGWDCSFAVEGNCVVTNSKQTFRSISIDVEEKSYSIRCGINDPGSNKICLDDIPDGYTLITGGKDTIFPAQIDLLEGQIVVIHNSGGDRSCPSRKFTVRNMQLIENN